MGDAIQRGGQRSGSADAAGLSCQDQEGCLKGIFCIGNILKNPSANRKHHRSMSADEDFKGGPIAMLDKSAQEIAVGSF
jgi:hypothetical protein